MARRSSFGSIVRKRLSDITNSQSQPKLVTVEEKQQSSVHNLINQLLEEKATLMKIIEERDKIIAVSDKQVRNLKTQYQKLQLQNWNLAQSNSQMLAEVNLGREKMKALQHELVCKDALLKAHNRRLEEGEKSIVQKSSNGIKRRTTRSQSLGPSSTTSTQEKLKNKKRCLRLKTEGGENLFEIEDVKLAMLMQEEGTKRCSVGRPVRRAAEKVQSYKEIPLNVKMRRPQ